MSSEGQPEVNTPPSPPTHLGGVEDELGQVQSNEAGLEGDSRPREHLYGH